ncbi:MAG TPA: ankyrin repeat domain-containing protein, partial [Flavisolibacter sp.]
MLRTCLLLILCIVLQRPAVSQELSEEQWEKLIPILQTDDSIQLAQGWADFSASGEEVLMVTALTNRPKLFAWTWRQVPGADFSNVDPLLMLALSGGFTEVPKLAHAMGWTVSPEVWAGVVTANYETYQLLLTLIGRPELLEMMPSERPDEAFVDAARWLVSIGIPYDYVLPEDRERLTPATWKVIAYLLEHQPPEDGQGDIANWKLAAAVQFSPAAEVRKLLEEGEGDPSFVEGNRSLLWYSVRRNDPLIAKYLLQFGADPLWQDSEGETSALAEAVAIGNADMVRELLPYIPSVNYRHRRGNTVLHYLADFSHRDIHDASNLCSVTADTAGVFTRGHLAIIRMLKDAGADFNAANEC